MLSNIIPYSELIFIMKQPFNKGANSIALINKPS